MKPRRRSPPPAALLVLALPLCLPGCMSAPAFERPTTALPSAWREAPPADGGALAAPATGAILIGDGVAYPPAAWWRAFGDPELEGLIAAAQRNNHDLRAAASRVVQAEARTRVAAADLYPTLGASTSGGRAGRAGEGLDAAYQAGFDASYEVDFWGGNRAAAASAGAAFEASRFDRETVALTLTADVATTYFRLLSLADRLESARKQLDIARRVLDLVRSQAEWGAVSELRVAQQRNTVASLEATLPTLERQRAETRNALAVLLGAAPEELEPPPAGGSLAAIEVPTVAPGLPAELLTRRPDIRSAEADLAAADADVHVARAALFPSIRLTGRGGFASAALTSLFDVGGSFYSLVTGLTAPIFDAGRLDARRDLAEARRDELVHRYRAAVIAAFRDVEDALAAARYLGETEAAQREALTQARRAYDLAEIQYRAGAVDFMTVLDAQRTLFQAEDALLQTRLARLNAAVALFRALGGGWGEGAAPEGATPAAQMDA
ncbi:MAG TPA: efflux transporter outer membrane subunit [Geminicoccaceae bacterium]|nr:efflux transporter outer membrane subunit [Geminicoccaceae bacterium]